MNHGYGKLPSVIGLCELKPVEVMYYLYLPISLPGQDGWVVPEGLKFLDPLMKMIKEDEPKRFKEEYIYLTVKRMFVGGSVTANRPGWHADGFLTDDLNYVWYDCLPTVFNQSQFTVTPDHIKSLVEFEEQALEENDVAFAPGFLLKLDSSCVHRVAMSEEQMMRLFVKVSMSKDKYNLKDNSINRLLDYNWEMHDREVVRNNPATAQRDSVPDDHFV